MTIAPRLQRPADLGRDQTRVRAGLVLLALLLVGPVAVAATWGLRRLAGARPAAQPHILIGAFVGVPAALILWVATPAADALGLLLKLWLVALPLAPLLALAWSGLDAALRWLLPKTLQEQVREEQRWLDDRDRAPDETPRARGRKGSPAEPVLLHVGGFLKGEHFPAGLGVVRQRGLLALEEGLLDSHLLLVGATGAGKTEAIKRLVSELFGATERDVILVDGKGDPALAEAFRSLAWAGGRGNAPVFRLGQGRPGAIYDGFAGDAPDLYNRLAALIEVGEMTGNAIYYADTNRALLQLICDAPEGPPRAFEELRERLSLDWLKRAWREDPGELRMLADFSREDVSGLSRHLQPYIRAFQPHVGPEGFRLEDVRAAAFSLRTGSAQDTASRFLRFLVEDLKDYAGKRQKRPAVLIIDEFSAFGVRNIVSLLALARSARLGIVLATQDAAGLGEGQTRRLILAGTRTKLLLASDFPEEIATLAGTIYQVESSVQHREGETTGWGSARVQHAFKIDMNEAARLRPGEAFLIRARHAAKLKLSTASIPDGVPPEPVGAARRPRVSTPPRKRAGTGRSYPPPLPDGPEERVIEL